MGVGGFLNFRNLLYKYINMLKKTDFNKDAIVHNNLKSNLTFPMIRKVLTGPHKCTMVHIHFQ